MIGIVLQDFLGFGDSIMGALPFPIHFGQAFPDDRGLGVERVGLLVEINGLGGVFGFAGVLVLLLVDVPHGEVEIGGGKRGRLSSGLGCASFLGEKGGIGGVCLAVCGRLRGERRASGAEKG